jgi:hypothetical protein
MTAPYTSPVSGLIQTIFGLREIQQRDEAQRLAREQLKSQQTEFGQSFGLQQQQAGVANAATHENQVTELSKLLQQSQDPKQFLPHLEELSHNTGMSQDLLKTLINQTVPSVETTKAGVVSKGAAGLTAEQQTAATTQNLAGMSPGGIAKDALDAHFIPAARSVYDSLKPDAKANFDKGVLQKVATGQSLREAALDVAFDHLSPADKTQAAKIGAQLAPGASEDAQIRLGWANLRLQDRKITSDSANDLLRIQAMMMEAKNKLKGDQLDKVNQVLKDMSQFEQYLGNSSSTFTADGKVRNDATLNAYQEQLRQLAPEIYGPNGTIPLKPLPLDKDMTTTSVFQGILQNLKKP